ncbi:hypothetical protein [Microbacterium sp.]|uniref:hypothetical protein n=1 Tax=Microbacterium sp. TaxID=51671 RepID=UPI003A900688
MAASLLVVSPALANDGASPEAVGAAQNVLAQTPASEQVAADAIIAPVRGETADILIGGQSQPISALLPADGAGEVIAANGVGIGLPAEASTNPAEVTATDLVSYPAKTEHDTSVVVQSTTSSTRIHTVIPDAQASMEYTYAISDATPKLRTDGSVELVADVAQWTPDGQQTVSATTVGEIRAPWARDANGAVVATHYEIRGNAVVQVVQPSKDTAFPVVADPDFWWWTGTIVTCAAQVAALFVAWAKIPSVLAKATKIINASAKLKAAVNKLGGLKKAIDAARQFVANKSKLSAASQNAVKALAVYGVSMLSDLLGVGSCVAIIRGS